MTVSSTINRKEYTGNGVTTAFAFPYLFLANADLKVYQAGVLKTITTHYTVTGAGNDAGGTVTFVTAPAADVSVVILRDPAITQGLDLVANDELPAESLEDGFDRLTLISQRLSDRMDRAMRLSDSDVTGASTTLPTPTANKVLGWDSTASGLRNVDASEIATLAAIGNYAVDHYDAGTHFTAGTTTQLTLGADPGTKNNTLVTFDGVVQHKDTYTLSGVPQTTLTFTSAIPVGTLDVEVFRAGAIAASVPSDASVTYKKLAGDMIFASIAKLKAHPVTGLVNGQIAFVTNYYDDGTVGGGGPFEWIAGSAATANGGTILAPDAGGVGRWRRIYSGAINVKWFGVRGDGVQDDTTYIQAAIDFTASMFNQVAFPPAGAFYDSPILEFPPGSYRLMNTLNVYVGLTLRGSGGAPYTVEHTRLIMDTVGGTVNLNAHILNPTRTFGGVQRANNLTVTIEDLGFWVTNPGSTLAGRGGTAFGVDANGVGSGGDACAIYCAEPCIDTRIKRCSFYAVPNAAIYFNANTTANCELHECEFDTSTIAVRAKNTALNLKINHNLFFSGSFHLHADNCTGSVFLNGNEFQFNARLKIFNGSVLDVFGFVGNKHDGSGAKDNAILVNRAEVVNISGNTFGLSTQSTIDVTDADGGVIANNAIVDSGYNATVSAAATDPGAIRMFGCKDLVVSANSIITPDAATYAGFGIVALDNGSRLSRCLIFGNHVSKDYTGTAHRNQGRHLNVSETDIVFGNRLGSGVSAPEQRHALTETAVHRTISKTQAAAGNVDIPLDGSNVMRACLFLSQVSTADSAFFEISIGRANSTAAYVIKDVAKDGVAGSGGGPHTLSAGNTVTFSISGTNLRMAFAFASDPMVYSASLVGAK